MTQPRRGPCRALLTALPVVVTVVASATLDAQPTAAPSAGPVLLRPERVFDGVSGSSAAGIVVLVHGDCVLAAQHRQKWN